MPKVYSIKRLNPFNLQKKHEKLNCIIKIAKLFMKKFKSPWNFCTKELKGRKHFTVEVENGQKVTICGDLT